MVLLNNNVVVVITKLSQPSAFCNSVSTTPTSVESHVVADNSVVLLDNNVIVVITKLSQPPAFCNNVSTTPTSVESHDSEVKNVGSELGFTPMVIESVSVQPLASVTVTVYVVVIVGDTIRNLPFPSPLSQA